MDDVEFQNRAAAALAGLAGALGAASELHPFEVDYHAGALAVEFEQPPGKFVVSPNSPVRQIWVSANVTSYKLDWNGAAFVLPATGQTLKDLMAEAVSRYLGREVTL